jgi:hypothetical protein
MRSSRRSLSRASSIGFGTLFLTVSYACSERAIAPTAADTANEFAVSGILSSSLWRVDGAQLTFAGSVSAQGRITQDKNGVHQEFEPTVVTHVAPSLSAPRLGLSPLRAPATNKAPLPEGAQVSWRSRLTSPRVQLTTRDGKRISMQRVADPRGGGRPPVATMLYDGDRPVSLIEGVYQKEGKHWKPTRARVTIFGKDGKPAVVTEDNFAALQTASVAMPGTAAAFADGFRRVGGSLARLIQPDALYAASLTEDDDERCWRQRLAVIGAAGTQVAADIALGVAITACGVSGGVLCPAVIAASIAATAAAVNYLIKVAEYDDCMSREDPIISSGGGGAGGGGESGNGCYDVVWEISYDGGRSWNYYDTQTVCEGTYEM